MLFDIGFIFGLNNCFTGVDIVNHLVKPDFNETLSRFVHRDTVDLVLLVAYSERDMLSYSSYCMAMSSIAVAVRYVTKSGSFEGVFFLLSLKDNEHCDEITQCSEALYQKMKRYPAYSDAAMED